MLVLDPSCMCIPLRYLWLDQGDDDRGMTTEAMIITGDLAAVAIGGRCIAVSSNKGDDISDENRRRASACSMNPRPPGEW